MLTLGCPNCGHNFPAPECCNATGSEMMQTSGGDQFNANYGGSYCNRNDFLVPRGYLNGGGSCVVNTSTIIHGPTIIQNQNERPAELINPKRIQQSLKKRPQLSSIDNNSKSTISPHCQIASNSVNQRISERIDEEELSGNSQRGIFQNPHPMLFPAPSGCQDLPGLQESRANATTAFDFQITQESDWSRTKNFNTDNKLATNFIHLSSNNGNSSIIPSDNNNSVNSNNSHSKLINNGVSSTPTVIQVNATLQLPPNVTHCTVSITATANTIPNCNRARNNFNGGGIVETDHFGNVGGNNCERDENSPTTPVSWVLPFPWCVNANTGNNSTDLERLNAAQRVLQASGWYYEGLSWQQSEALLKNAPVGYWLIRDSSDKRYMYAVSVQTARGPTAVRVHYVCGKFRLDAEPRMAPLMPMFDCPVKMIEHYIEYSKKMSEQKEVWVDHSGQLYSQIYLTKPLLKEVRSLSHSARLAVNRSNISTKQLPNPLREYIADYPYTE